MKIKLAEALLRRKELQEKVDQLRQIDNRDLFEVKARRKQAAEGIDDVIAEVPKVSFKQLTHAYDWHAKQLRFIDAIIQQTNWQTVVEVPNESMGDYRDPFEEQSKPKQTPVRKKKVDR